MTDATKLKELLKQQNELMEEIARETSSLSGDGLLAQIEQLKEDNERLRKACSDAESARDTLLRANQNLRENLQQQQRIERARILNASQERMCAYFGAAERGGVSRLTALEEQARKQFDTHKHNLELQEAAVRESLYTKLQAVEDEITAEITRVKNAYRNSGKYASGAHAEQITPLGEPPVSAETTGKLMQKQESKVERVIGMRILSAVGATLMILGVITLAYFLNDYIPNIVTVLLFCIATAALGVGLFINRKPSKRTMFSMIVLCIGVGLEYTALTVSYFAFGLNLWAALGICVAVTAVGYALSLVYKNELVAIFTQIGGYLPVLTLFESFLSGEMNMAILYGAMVYFIILNVTGFLLSSKYKWQILNYIGFGLSIFAIAALSSCVAALRSAEEAFGLKEGLTLGFMFISFALHTLLPVLTNLRVRSRFTVPDFILLALTASVNLILFYTMFGLYGIEDFSGYLSLFFAAFYFGLYVLIRRFFTADTSVRTLFWLTGIVFTALFMPMQFDVDWLSFGWVLQSAAIVCYGILRERKFAFWTGVSLFGISLSTLLFVDIIQVYGTAESLLIYKHLTITLASIAMLIAFLYKKKLSLGYLGGDKRIFLSERITPVSLYSSAVYLNFAGFLVHAIYKIFDAAAPFAIGEPGNIQFLMLALMVLSISACAIVIPKLFIDRSVRIFSTVLAGISLLFAIIINLIPLPAFANTAMAGEKIAAGFLVCICGALSVYVFYDLLRTCALLSKRFSVKAQTVYVALYGIGMYALILWQQFRLEFTNISIAIGFLLTAAVCLAIGLVRKDAIVRRFALALVGVSTFKLLVIDTWSLELVYRFIGYFAFGAGLIGMGFLYQLFFKKIGGKKQAPEEEETPEPEPETSTEAETKETEAELDSQNSAGNQR